MLGIYLLSVVDLRQAGCTLALGQVAAGSGEDEELSWSHFQQ